MSAASSPDSPIYALRQHSPNNTLFYDSASPASSLSPRNAYDDDDETFISREGLTDDSDDDVGGSANKRNKTSKHDLRVVKKAKRGRPKGKASLKKKKSSAKSSPTPAFVAPALSINSNNLLSRNQPLAFTSPTSYIDALSNSNLDQINFTSPVHGSTNTGPAPIISELATRLPAIFHGMRMEATQVMSLQADSQGAVEESIARLPTHAHRTALCLAMNRYSAFAASPLINVPAFPVTSAKVTLFISRSLPNLLGSQLRLLIPAPANFPLPVVGGMDGIAPDVSEGATVTRDLVGSWTEALAYAQGASREVWENVLVGGAPRDLMGDEAIVDMLRDFKEYEDRSGNRLESFQCLPASVPMVRAISRPLPHQSVLYPATNMSSSLANYEGYSLGSYLGADQPSNDAPTFPDSPLSTRPTLLPLVSPTPRSTEASPVLTMTTACSDAPYSALSSNSISPAASNDSDMASIVKSRRRKREGEVETAMVNAFVEEGIISKSGIRAGETFSTAKEFPFFSEPELRSAQQQQLYNNFFPLPSQSQPPTRGAQPAYLRNQSMVSSLAHFNEITQLPSFNNAARRFSYPGPTVHQPTYAPYHPPIDFLCRSAPATSLQLSSTIAPESGMADEAYFDDPPAHRQQQQTTGTTPQSNLLSNVQHAFDTSSSTYCTAQPAIESPHRQSSYYGQSFSGDPIGSRDTYPGSTTSPSEYIRYNDHALLLEQLTHHSAYLPTPSTISAANRFSNPPSQNRYHHSRTHSPASGTSTPSHSKSYSSFELELKEAEDRFASANGGRSSSRGKSNKNSNSLIGLGIGVRENDEGKEKESGK